MVPLRGRGDRERARRGRRAAGLQPLRRAAARRGDDRQGDQGGAPAPAPALPHRRALLQGLSGLLMLLPEDRRACPRTRPTSTACSTTSAARARLPRGPQGHREALQGPLPAAALRPRRLRRGGDARPGADRPHRAWSGPRRPLPVFAQVKPLQRLTGLLYFPITPTFPHFGLLGMLGYLPAKFKIRFLPRCRPTIPPSATSRGRTRRWCRPSPHEIRATHPGGARRDARRAAQRLVRMSVASGSCVTGLSTYWGGRLAQALERDPAVEAIIGVDRAPAEGRARAHRVRARDRLSTRCIRADRRGGRDRHGGRHAAGRRLDRHQPAAGPREQRDRAR